MIPFLIQGLTLGFSAAVTPGPFQAFLFAESVRRGWRRAWPSALAPLLSDGPIIALIVLVLARTPFWLVAAIRLIGGGYLLLLAVQMFRAAAVLGEAPPDPAGVSPQSLLRAALVNASSPGPYLFWGLLAGPILLDGWRSSPPQGLSFLLGFYGTLIGGSTALVAFFSIAGRSGTALRRVLIQIGGLLMFGFGLFQIAGGLQGLGG